MLHRPVRQAILASDDAVARSKRAPPPLRGMDDPLRSSNDRLVARVAPRIRPRWAAAPPCSTGSSPTDPPRPDPARAPDGRL